MSARLLDRLAAARRRAFVGRDAELALFRSLLRPGEAGAVLFVLGPGGIGKSALLRHFGWLAEAAQRTVVWLDGRDLHTGPASALAALGTALDLTGGAPDAARAPGSSTPDAKPGADLDAERDTAPGADLDAERDTAPGTGPGRAPCTGPGAGPAQAPGAGPGTGPSAPGTVPAPGGGDDPLAMLGELRCAVLIVDNVELLALMDCWLRDELLPRLRADAVVVLAGREPPSVAFRADPGWRSVLRTVRLSNLDREHGEELLRLRGVPDALHGQAMAFTHGCPLALALLADVCAQSETLPAATATPKVLGVLLDSLIGSVPSPAHLAALEATSQVLVTTEPLLAALLDADDTRELFDWLRDLSIMDYAPRGLFPHDLVRERLVTELRWRHPDAHAAIRNRACAYYHRQFAGADPAAQRALLFEFAFLHRDNPVVGPYLRHVNPGTGSSRFTIGRVADGEWPALAEIVARHEGAESAQLAHHWYRSQPASVSVIRASDGPDSEDGPDGPDGSVAGLLVAPMLEAATTGERDADPATAAAWRYLAQRRLPADGAMVVRHWMSAADHQSISEVQTFIMLSLVRHCLATPGLTQVFVTCADPEFWNAAFDYTDFHRLAGADFEVGGRRYGMFGHDWRTVAPMAWIAKMADRTAPAEDAGPDGAAADTGLSEPEFADAVRAALRDLTRLDRLHGAALGRSRLVSGLLPGAPTATDRAKAIRDVVRSAAAVLESSPRDRKLFRVLHHTFLQPADTQARAAELLDLPTSTYRRHLAAGVARLAEILWKRESDL